MKYIRMVKWGVCDLSVSCILIGLIYRPAYYEIVDQKLFFLSVIKYGLEYIDITPIWYEGITFQAVENLLMDELKSRIPFYK